MRASRLARGAVVLAVCVATAGFGPDTATIDAQLTMTPGAGVVVATLDGGKSEVRTYGTGVDENARFEVGSLTKTFTATLFADMLLRHEVSADDPIDDYLPKGTTAPAFAGTRITLGDLATQSSGLPRMPANFVPANGGDPYADYSDDALFAFLRSYALTRAPGKTFEYSNLGFGLLGNLLARRLGVDYATALRTRVLLPLGMTHSDVATPEHPIATVAGHDADGDPAGNWRFASLAGAGGLVSTCGDMLRFARAALAQHGPLAAELQLALSPRAPADGLRRIGYAWLTEPDGVVWHNGGTAGFHAFLGLDRARERAVLILANAPLSGLDAAGLHALDGALADAPAPKPDFPLDRATLEAYAGRYGFADDSTATVELDSRGLTVTFDRPALRSRLHAVSPNAFRLLAAPVVIRFAGAGVEMTMTVTQPGEDPDVGHRIVD